MLCVCVTLYVRCELLNSSDGGGGQRHNPVTRRRTTVWCVRVCGVVAARGTTTMTTTSTATTSTRGSSRRVIYVYSTLRNHTLLWLCGACRLHAPPPPHAAALHSVDGSLAPQLPQLPPPLCVCVCVNCKLSPAQNTHACAHSKHPPGSQRAHAQASEHTRKKIIIVWNF